MSIRCFRLIVIAFITCQWSQILVSQTNEQIQAMEEIRSMIEAIECTREGDKPQYDGIIVPEKWFTRLDSDQLRIMYLMKNQTDKSGTDKGGHDIAYIRRHDRTLSDVEDDGGLQTYECPVIIGYMLEKNVSFADVPSNYKMSEEVYTIWKNMSAWVNVDKELTHGTSKTSTDKLRKAAKKYNIKQVAVAGGVSANNGLRNAFKDHAQRFGWDIFIPKFSYTTDNAAMIAITGYFKYLDKDFCPMEAPAYSRVTLS